MKSISSRSCSCTLSSLILLAMQYDALEMGKVPSSSSIPKSTAHKGGTPSKSSRKTSRNSFTIGTVSIVFSFHFTSIAQARAHPSYCTRHLALIIDTIFRVTPVQVPLNLKLGLVGGKNTTSFLW